MLLFFYVNITLKIPCVVDTLAMLFVGFSIDVAATSQFVGNNIYVDQIILRSTSGKFALPPPLHFPTFLYLDSCQPFSVGLVYDEYFVNGWTSTYDVLDLYLLSSTISFSSPYPSLYMFLSCFSLEFLSFGYCCLEIDSILMHIFVYIFHFSCA